jgi:hypothetical protein
VRRSFIQRGCDDPTLWLRKRWERCGHYRLGRGELICRLLNAYVVEPDDALISVRKLGRVVAVKGFNFIVVVGFEVAMDNGLGMVIIPFVHVFGRDRGRQYESRPKRERDGRAPQRMHDLVIMGYAVAVGQTE